MGETTDIQMPLGIDPEIDEGRLYNGTGQALVEGDFVCLDETKSGTDGSAASNTTTNLTQQTFTAVRLAVTADITTAAAIGCWAQESIPIGGIGRFRVNGTTKVKLAADLNANVARNLTAVNGATTMAASAASGNKVFAKAVAGPTNIVVATNPLCQAWGKGIAGFGGTQ
jgi:hypothetical protein